MAFVKRPYATATLSKGDNNSKVVIFADSQLMRAGNGIYMAHSTSTDVEGFLAGIEAEIDGTFTKYAGPDGTYSNADAIIPNDTAGDSLTKVFTVSFSDHNEKCAIVIPWVKATGNITTLANTVKGQAFKKADGTSLTISAVEVKQSF